MSDYKLSRFGVRVPEESEDTNDPDDHSEQEKASSTPRYPNGRCPALLIDEGRRCRSPTSRMKASEPFCGTHGRQRRPITIDDGPETLIMLIGGIGHVATLRAVDQDEVDFDLERIQEAVEAVKRGGD